MAVKPETRFTASINKHVSKEVYWMKNNNPYIGGIPDSWYSGKKGDLWVEYKYVEKLPKRVNLRPLDLLSTLQKNWLNDRYDEGRNVAVIIGCPEGGFLLRDKEWNNEIAPSLFDSLILSKTDLAGWITGETAGL